MTDLSGAGVRVLLLGTATHPGPLLSPVPAAGRSATALADRLIRRCGVPPGQLRTIVDPPDAHSMAAAVSEEARRAESVLLIYYIGHGLPGPAGELYLAATGTDSLTPGLAAHQALPFSAIREAIGSCRADAVVVVLDCCFSARAGLDGRRPESAFTLPAAHGAYVLAAAQQLALAPEEEEYTTFSGELLRLLDEGDPLGPRRLTLDDVYEHLFRTLRAQGAPLPRRQVADRAGSLVVAANLAYRDVVDAPAEPEADLTDVRCPYLGLSSFGVDDAELFRGRGALIAELFDAVARTLTGTLPLLVVGASGAGKSSLLSAGLLAGLANGVPGLPGTAGWPSIMLTPGERPVEVLATRLDPTGESAAQRLREDPTHAGRLAAALRERHGTERLVVVVDQLEQLFTPALDDLDRRVFLRALAAITGHALVVMALRADFFGHAMAHEELAAALRGNQLLVGPMGLDELQAAIEEPATTVGLRLDDGLADLMLLELGATRRSGADTGALPLLSHALWATWQRRTGARMTVAGYRASGGIAQAIATTADATYKALDPAGQEAVRRMLPRLVRVDDELNDTARTVDLADLQRGVPDPAAAERALHRLAAARLVTLDRATARISHEALLREWPLLRRWIDADRDWLRTHEQLRMDALAWRHAEQDQSLLYRGSRLATVRERAAGSSRLDELEPVTAEFLDRSSRQEGRTARLRTAVVAGLATLLVLALTATGAAVYQARAAATETRAAVVNSLVSRSGAVRDSQPATALRLGIAAATVDPSAETRAGLVRLLLGSRYAGEFHASDGPEVRGVVVSDDGRTAVVAAGELASTVWDVGDRAAPRQIGSLPHPKGKGWHTGATEAIGASADGRLVLDGNSVWDLHDPTRPVPVTWLPRRDDDNEGPTYAVAYNEARRLGIVGGGIQGQPRIHGIAALWDLHDPARPVRLGELAGHSGPVWTAAFSPDGDTVVTGSGSGTAVLWDVRSRRHPRRVAALTGHVGNVWTAAFGPDGRTVLTGAATDSNAVLWDVSTVALPHRIGVLAHGGPVSVVTFSADGQRLFTAGTDGNIRMWNAQDPAQAVPLSTAPARAVAFDGRGGLAITSGWGDASQEPPRRAALGGVGRRGTPIFVYIERCVPRPTACVQLVLHADRTDRRRKDRRHRRV